MHALSIRIPQVCACDQNSEYCTMCPRKECSGKPDCMHCSEEIHAMQMLVKEFCASGDSMTQADILRRKCDFAKGTPSFFAAHPSVRTSVQGLLVMGLALPELTAWHGVFREAQVFLRNLAWRSDWRT